MRRWDEVNAIEIKGLSKSFGSKHAVNGLNMTVPEGAIYGFIGENEAADAQTFTNAWRVLEMVQVVPMAWTSWCSRCSAIPTWCSSSPPSS